MKTKTTKRRAAYRSVKPRTSLKGLLPTRFIAHGHVIQNEPALNRGPYLNCELETVLEFVHKDRRFYVFTYTSFAGAPKRNGIAICDIDLCEVVCDDICRQQLDANRPNAPVQRETLHRFTRLNWENFKQFVNNHPRRRGKL